MEETNFDFLFSFYLWIAITLNLLFELKWRTRIRKRIECFNFSFEQIMSSFLEIRETNIFIIQNIIFYLKTIFYFIIFFNFYNRMNKNLIVYPILLLISLFIYYLLLNFLFYLYLIYGNLSLKIFIL